MQRVIVSRHQAAIEFVALELSGSDTRDGAYMAIVEDIAPVEVGQPYTPSIVAIRRADPPDLIPVIASATPADVAGKEVYGNLPLHLAALTAEVWAIEFAGAAGRGEIGLNTDVLAALQFPSSKYTEECRRPYSDDQT